MAIPLAVAGAGRVASCVHLPLLHLMPELFRLAAIVETDPIRTADLEREYPGVVVCGDLAKARDAGAEAVLCATPWPTHGTLIREALELGMPVLCEKPVTLDPAELDALCQAQARSGVPVSVGYMKRHDPAVARFIEQAAALHDELRALTVRIVDPNGPHQLEHRLVAPLMPSPHARAAGDAVVCAVVGDAPGRSVAYAHGLGGSLVHQVNLVHAVLAGAGRSLLGRLGYARHWAEGTAVSCGWWPSPNLGVQLSHLRAPGCQNYTEVVEAVTQDSILRLELGSPYLLDVTARLTHIAPDGETRSWSAPPRENGFARQLRAWAASLRDPAAAALPGLSEARRDLEVVHEAGLVIQGSDIFGVPTAVAQ